MKFSLCPRPDCDGLLFRDLTNTTTDSYPSGADVGSYTGQVKIYRLPRVSGDSPVAIYAVQPTIDPTQTYDIIFSDPDVDDLADGFYEAEYTVMDGSSEVGSVVKAKFAYTCNVECKMAAAGVRILNGGCDLTATEYAEIVGIYDAMIAAFNQDEFDLANKGLDILKANLSKCNC